MFKVIEKGLDDVVEFETRKEAEIYIKTSVKINNFRRRSTCDSKRNYTIIEMEG